jgi:hypothetical protein
VAVLSENKKHNKSCSSIPCTCMPPASHRQPRRGRAAMFQIKVLKQACNANVM